MKIVSNESFFSVTLAWAMACLAAGTVSSRAEVKEEFHQTYALDKEGKVHLENVNGTVRITSWERAEVQVDAIKKAKTQRELDEVKIEVDSKPGSIRIQTKYPDSRRHKNNSTSVDYTLKVPKASRLDKICSVNGGVEIENVTGPVTAESVNGSVTATGLAGRVKLSTVNGAAKASFAVFREGASIESVNGGVAITVPPDTKATVSGSTVNGGISSDFPLQARKSFPVGGHLEGKLGDGGPEIKVTTVNGGIRIHRGRSLEAEAR